MTGMVCDKKDIYLTSPYPLGWYTLCRKCGHMEIWGEENSAEVPSIHSKLGKCNSLSPSKFVILIDAHFLSMLIKHACLVCSSLSETFL